MNYEVRAYLATYIEIVQKDIDKMEAIAKEAERLQKKRDQNPQPANAIHTTISPNTTPFHSSASERFGGCTIPLATTCLSVFECIGLLISPTLSSAPKFEQRVKNLFDYVGNQWQQSEIDMLREIYRNGMMHGFFQKGEKMGVSYLSKYDTEPKIFVIEQDLIILNVNRLVSIVKLLFEKIFNDDEIHSTIGNNITQQTQNNTLNINAIIQRFREINNANS